MNIHPDVVKAYKKTLDADDKHAEHGTTITKRNATRAATHLSKKIKQHHGDLSSSDKIKLRTKLQSMNEGKTSELIKKSHAKRGKPGTLKAKIKGEITPAKARALKNKPGATTLDKKQANFYLNMHEEMMTAADAGIPHDTKNMGPRNTIRGILRRKIGLPINVTDRRRRKDKPPRLITKYRKK